MARSWRKRTLYETLIENIRYFVYTGFICNTDIIKAFMLSALPMIMVGMALGMLYRWEETPMNAKERKKGRKT